MSLANYDPDEISVSIAGVPVDPKAGSGGYGPDTFLSIEFTSPRFSTQVGVDGKATRSKMLDRSAKATLTLMQSSLSNDLLSALAILDANTPNGAGVGAFLVRDRNGTSIYEAAECWIESVPNPQFGKEATTREWVIAIAKLNAFTGSE